MPSHNKIQSACKMMLISILNNENYFFEELKKISLWQGSKVAVGKHSREAFHKCKHHQMHLQPHFL